MAQSRSTVLKYAEDENADSEDSSERDSEDDSSHFDLATEYSNQRANVNVCENLNFSAEIEKILQIHNDVCFENALQLNKEMQRQLIQMREKLQQLLRQVNDRYQSNEKRMALSMRRGVHQGFGIRGAYLKGGTFYFKGIMFFKNHNARNCPNNGDYKHRSLNEGEMFPMDFELRGRHVWSMQDKAGIVEAIKEQAFDYLERKKPKQTVRRRRSNNDLQKKITVHTEKLVNLLAQVGEDFQIDWEQVAAYNLNYRHSAYSCEAMWQLYLHPSLKRSEWTSKENQRLIDAVKKHNFQDWTAIAAEVSNRSEYQCFVQYQTTTYLMQPDRWNKWNKADDKLLTDVIQKSTVNGMVNWGLVMTHFPHTPKTTLQARYVDRLNPQISHAPFSAQEDLLLLAAVEEYGEKFSCLPRILFPNRSLTQLRSRYQNTLKQRESLDPWSVEDDKKLMEFTATHGISSWLQCAQMLGNHSRTSCRTRFITIKKFFEKDPNACFEDLPRKRVRVVDNTITPQNWAEKLDELRENPNANFKPTNRKDYRRLYKAASATLAKKRSHQKQEALQENVSKPTKRKPQRTGSTLTSSTQLSVRERRPVDRRYPVYLDRLRATELQLYQFFKYAYNFRLGITPSLRLPNKYAMGVVAHALHFRPSNEAYRQDDSFSAAVRRKCKELLSQRTSVDSSDCQLLPPSWPTAMAFRALCVQSIDMSTSCDTKVNQHEYKAVGRFRTRFRALFYQTALLSRLHPDCINNSSMIELCQQSPVTTTEETKTSIKIEINVEEEFGTDKSFARPITNTTNKRKRTESVNETEDDDNCDVPCNAKQFIKSTNSD